MIYLDVGQKGSGKTYNGTLEVLNSIMEGVDCYTDWDIDFNRYFYYYTHSILGKLLKRKEKIKKFGKLFRFHKLSDVYGVRNGRIWVDEAYRHLNARDWEATPPEFISKMAQSRHFKCDLHFICQYPNQVDNVVRKLADQVVVHYKYFFFLGYKVYPANVVDKINDPDPENPPKSEYTGFHIFNKRVAECYNSWHLNPTDIYPDFASPPVWSYDIFDRWVNVLYSQKTKVLTNKLNELKKEVTRVIVKQK